MDSLNRVGRWARAGVKTLAGIVVPAYGGYELGRVIGERRANRAKSGSGQGARALRVFGAAVGLSLGSLVPAVHNQTSAALVSIASTDHVRYVATWESYGPVNPLREAARIVTWPVDIAFGEGTLEESASKLDVRYDDHGVEAACGFYPHKPVPVTELAGFGDSPAISYGQQDVPRGSPIWASIDARCEALLAQEKGQLVANYTGPAMR